MTIIRHAAMSDVPRIVSLLTGFAWKEGVYREIQCSPERVREMIAQLVTRMDAIVLVADRGGEIGGVIAGIKVPSWWYDGDQVANLTWYVRPDWRNAMIGMKLFGRYMGWVSGWKSVKQVIAGGTMGGDLVNRVDAAYRRFGFTKTGGAYMRVMQ